MLSIYVEVLRGFKVLRGLKILSVFGWERMGENSVIYASGLSAGWIKVIKHNTRHLGAENE